MTLAQSLTAAAGEMRGTCPVKIALDTWDPTDATWLHTQLTATATIPASLLSAAVTLMTPRLASTDIAAHRATDCPCIIPTTGV